MTNTPTLTPEEEAHWRRTVQGPGSAHLNNSVLRAVFALLDAERARMREELAVVRAHSEAAGVELDQYRALAAEMAEALTRARVAVVTWAADPTEPLIEIDTALARYRAQGIGGEKGSSEAQVREMRSEEWPHD